MKLQPARMVVTEVYSTRIVVFQSEIFDKMVQSEIDNFFVKFKNFLHSGSDATLTVRSEAGKASLTLLLYVGHVFHPSADHLSDI